jgi:enoyl-CoA hydratase/carnithine racemase
MADTGDPRIRLLIDGTLAIVTLARPEKLNALDMEMILALERACHLIELERDVRVALLTGEGSKAFCAGGDVADWSQYPAFDFGNAWVRHGHRAFDALARLRVPVVAVLNGHVLGGGLEVAACADFRVAEAHVTFGQPETGLGIIPGWSGTQRAVRRFGAQIVRRMALAGETFKSDEALKLGIADVIVPQGEGLTKGRELAAQIAARGPAATQIVKQLINAAEGEEMERPLEALAGALAASTDQLKEGLAAFKEKRKPNF